MDVKAIAITWTNSLHILPWSIEFIIFIIESEQAEFVDKKNKATS